MKSPLRSRLRSTMSVRRVLSAGQIAIGGHLGDWDEDGTGTSPALVRIQSGGGLSRSLLALTFTDPNIYGPPTDNKGNTFGLLESSGYFASRWSPYGMEAYGVANAVGGVDHDIQFTKTDAVRESTLLAIEVVNAPVIQDTSIVTRDGLGDGVPYVSASVTTTGPAMLIASWGGDGGVAIASQVVNVENGWTMLDSSFRTSTPYIQAAVAARYVATAGTYTVQWTPVSSQGAILFLSAHQGA